MEDLVNILERPIGERLIEGEEILHVLDEESELYETENDEDDDQEFWEVDACN